MQEMNIAVCPRRVLPVFFLLDTSGSMFGERIAALNESMRYMLEAFMHESFTDSTYEVRVSVIDIKSRCRLLRGKPTPVEELYWDDLCAGGVSPFGAAFWELEHQLNRRTMFPNNEPPAMPIIVLTADGESTDNWKEPLEQLWKNQWYQRALKFAFGIGDGVGEEMLEKVTGNKETVFLVSDGHELAIRMKELVRILRPTPPIPIPEPCDSEIVVSAEPVSPEDINWEGIW